MTDLRALGHVLFVDADAQAGSIRDADETVVVAVSEDGSAMLEKDRVGFIAREPLESLRKRSGKTAAR